MKELTQNAVPRRTCHRWRPHGVGGGSQPWPQGDSGRRFGRPDFRIVVFPICDPRSQGEESVGRTRTVDAVLETGERYNLRNWVLFPTRDETVVAFARHRDELAKFFKVTTPDWTSVQWAWDKKNTYQMAEKLGIPCPRPLIPEALRNWSRFTLSCLSPSSPQ